MEFTGSDLLVHFCQWNCGKSDSIGASPAGKRICQVCLAWTYLVAQVLMFWLLSGLGLRALFFLALRPVDFFFAMICVEKSCGWGVVDKLGGKPLQR